MSLLVLQIAACQYTTTHVCLPVNISRHNRQCHYHRQNLITLLINNNIITMSPSLLLLMLIFTLMYHHHYCYCLLLLIDAVDSHYALGNTCPGPTGLVGRSRSCAAAAPVYKNSCPPGTGTWTLIIEHARCRTHPGSSARRAAPAAVRGLCAHPVHADNNNNITNR